MQFIFFRILFKRIGAISSMMRDKTVPKRKKVLIIFGILYLFSPIDLIPPVLFPIGWVDDLVIWLWIIFHLRDTLDSYWKGKENADFSKKYEDKDVIDADFEVKK
ncbi:hypothetical protein FACS1894127_3540 [Clostridia bacterium]|nr:hypothetical protein FACS1894127_3540 [Clostridia bacterium]